MWHSIVFVQDDEADEPLNILRDNGEEATIEYLAQWDYGDETQFASEVNGHTYSSPADCAGTHDTVSIVGDYALTYNLRIGYVGLCARSL